MANREGDKRMATPSLGSKWMEALEVAISGDPEQVPEGWHTVRQVAEATDRSETWTYKKLEAMVRQGKAEKRKFRVEAVTQVRPVTHYRMIDDEG